MSKWYVLVVAGSEELFCRNVLQMASSQGIEGIIEEIVVPTRKKNPEDAVGEKVFPGYVLVKADMTGSLVSFLSKIPRFNRFAGGIPPVPLSEKEVRVIFDNAEKLLEEPGKAMIVGSEVKIVKGPFTGFVGIVESFDVDEKRVQLAVSIFGRMTSITVDMSQIEG